MEAEQDQPQSSCESALTGQPRVPDSRLPGSEGSPADSRHDGLPKLSDSQDNSEAECQDHGYEFSAMALWPVFILLTIAVLLTVGTGWYGPRRMLQELLRYVMPERPQVWHAFAIWGAIVACIVCSIPVLLILLPVPTLIFGFWKGCLITFMGLMCAATLSFFIGRTVARRPVRRYLEGKGFTRIMRLLHVMEDSEDQSMRLLILYRFLPIPMGVRNYGPSVLRVPIPKLILASIPHSMWSAIVFATAGSTLRGPAQLLRDGDKIPWRTPHWQQVLGLVMASLSGIIFTWVAWQAYTQKGEEEEETRAAAKNASSTLTPSAQGGSYGTTAGA